METDELSQSQAPTVTSQDTRIARSTYSRISPTLPPGLFLRAAMRRSPSQQSQTPAVPLLSPERTKRLDRINRSLHLYKDNLAQSTDQEHLAFQSLPPQIQHLIREQCTIKSEIIMGARYIGTKLEQIDTSMVQVQAATKGLQEAPKRVGGRMDGQDNRQTRQAQVISQLQQTIQSEGAAAMGRDEQLGQELLDTKAQHQRELQNHERILNAMMAELEANKGAREREESHIADLTAAVTSLMGQVKAKHSNPPPERSATATGVGGGGRPPPTMHGAAGGTPDPGESEGEGSDDERRGTRDERPDKRNKKPAEKEQTDEEKYGEATEDEMRFSRALGKAIGETTKCAARLLSEYEHAKHPDIRFWLTTCKDLFDRNPYQWQDEADGIKYALSKLKESQVASFAMTYRNQMTGELGHIRQEGYELWDVFAEQAIPRFGPTHEEEKTLREMLKVRYRNDINQFLLEIENWNLKVKVTGIAFRKLNRDQIPDEAVRRISMHHEYADDRDWIEPLRQAVRDEEDSQEGKRLKDNNFWGSNSSGKRKRDEPITAKTTKKPKYTTKEKRLYQAKKKEEKVDKGKVAPRQQIMHTVWANAHTGIDQKVVDERKGKGQCTRCTLTNHRWKHCQKEIRVSTIQRKSFRLLEGKSNHPKPKKPRVPAVAEDSCGENPRQASQRPLAWTFMEEEEL